jgi:hypothetical protein
MKALVVYESHWGNTETIARAIAEGIGPDAVAVPTDVAGAAVVEDADLLVVGAPVIAFGLASEAARSRLATTEGRPPDVSHPSMRSWLGSLPPGSACSAAFETRIWWSPRGATGDIERGLARAGYRRIADARKFVVTDTCGPLRDGELDRARAWGQSLASLASTLVTAA